jgi:hypothetical protein
MPFVAAEKACRPPTIAPERVSRVKVLMGDIMSLVIIFASRKATLSCLFLWRRLTTHIYYKSDKCPEIMACIQFGI